MYLAAHSPVNGRDRRMTGFPLMFGVPGSTVAQWLRCCATNQKVAVRSQLVSLEFFIDTKSFRSHYGPGFDSASNRNEYQEYFLGVNAASLGIRTSTTMNLKEWERLST